MSVSQADSQSVHVQTVGCTAAAAVAWQWAAGCAGQHRCHRSVKLQSAELGLWSGADWFLTASVCVSGMHCHKCEVGWFSKV